MGDRIIVEVKNLMTSESTTLHWHGQHQNDNPYMDGTPFVQQCPILPGQTFIYDFVAKTPGTHFWHSHVGKYLITINLIIKYIFYILLLEKLLFKVSNAVMDYMDQ